LIAEGSIRRRLRRAARRPAGFLAPTGGSSPARRGARQAALAVSALVWRQRYKFREITSGA